MSKSVLQARMVGYATDRTGHVMAPMEVVYACDEPKRKVIPLKAKLWALYILAMVAYGIIQGGINTFS